MNKFKLMIHQCLTCHHNQSGECSLPIISWCSSVVVFGASSTPGSWSGMLKTPLQCSCLSGLHAWCQHSWASSEARTHKLAVDVSIKIAQHFTQMHRVTYLHSALMICTIGLSAVVKSSQVKMYFPCTCKTTFADRAVNKMHVLS